MKNWIKKWWKTIALILLAIAVFIGNICVLHFVDESNSQSAWLTLISGWVSGIATIILGIIAVVQNMKYKKENDISLEKQEKKADEDKRILLEQNRIIATNNARYAVLPIMSVNLVPYTINQRLFESPKPLTQSEKVYGYFENESWYFAAIVGEKEIRLQKDEPIEIKDYKNNLFTKRKDANGVCVLSARKDVFAPIIIKNVGMKTALHFSFAIYKNDCIDEKFRKYITARNFDVKDELRIDFYFSEKGTNSRYWLEFTYDDILGNKYIQKGCFIDENNGIQLDLTFNQLLQEQNNG